MIRSCDAGSLPSFCDLERFSAGAEHYLRHLEDDLAKYFETITVTSFIDKMETGIHTPNYPQFRDMNEMFFGMIKGVKRIQTGYAQTDFLSVRTERRHIPEVLAMKEHSKEIYERTGATYQARMCVTGPYTLSSMLTHRTGKALTNLGNLISQIIENNVFGGKYGRISLVAIDEPIFGLLDDPLIEYGSVGRECLSKAWESICQKSISKGAQTCLHLHSTTDTLFWHIRPLNIIESHVDNSLYTISETKEHLESTDKFLKASVCITDFDKLIRQGVGSLAPHSLRESTMNQKIADTWEKIRCRDINPETFVERVGLMRKRLDRILTELGGERVLFAGPECGLKGFPTYECALECLRRVASVVEAYQKNA